MEAWVADLEESVRRATAEIARLREANSRLAAELERRASAPADPARPDEGATRATSESEAEAGAAELEAVRRRVRALVTRLESLLPE